MEFRKLLLTAKAGDQTALEQLFFMYRPLIISRSMVDGVFWEELYQEIQRETRFLRMSAMNMERSILKSRPLECTISGRLWLRTVMS